MIKTSDRIDSFIFLGKYINDFLIDQNRRENPLFSELDRSIEQAGLMNAWFTRDSVEHALSVWADRLRRTELEKWLTPYSLHLIKPASEKNVAVIMAGNIPLVGFHDFLSVLLSGNKFIGRLSSNDSELLPALARILIKHNSSWNDLIAFTKERITGFDAVIATGTNNSSNYFNYYFSKVPHIIRRNRNGIAILTGDEDENELKGIADDVFLYYGLGCRNVTKLYLPAGYDVAPLFNAFLSFGNFSTHNKWMNNHNYYRSVFLLNQISAMDNGFLLLTENKAIASPPSVLYFEYYSEMNTLMEELLTKKDEIQVVVCKKPVPFSSCLPGCTQTPDLSDYADGVDVIHFLLDLSK